MSLIFSHSGGHLSWGVALTASRPEKAPRKGADLNPRPNFTADRAFKLTGRAGSEILEYVVNARGLLR